MDTGIIYSFASDFLKEDLGRGDITTEAVVRGGSRGKARFIAKERLVLCGLEIAEAVFAVIEGSIELESRAHDGEVVEEATEFAQVYGPAAVLLAGERTALNLLQRLSGIATVTKAFVDCIAGTPARIVDTRKTTPGLRLLEKYAVTVGGGHNHRFGLDDGVLIKNNHISMVGGVRKAVALARQGVPHLHKIEVEVTSESQLKEAIEAAADVVMLDNMNTEQVLAAVKLIRDRAPATIIEVSGNVTLETVRELAECGVDLISVGAITHSAKAVDISMRITPQ